MKKYKFRLERLLELRKHKERIWETKLAQATGKCVLLENYIRDAQAETVESAGFSGGSLIYSAADIQARELYRKRLEREIEQAGEKLKNARVEREDVNRSYLTASRDRKVLDRLKERKTEEYYAQQRREEAKIMNETAMFQLVGREGGE